MDNKWHPWVWVKWKGGAPTTAWESWRGNKTITEAWTTQGEWDCCLCLDVTDHDQLEQFVWKNIRSNQWVEATRTTWTKRWW